VKIASCTHLAVGTTIPNLWSWLGRHYALSTKLGADSTPEGSLLCYSLRIKPASDHDSLSTGLFAVLKRYLSGNSVKAQVVQIWHLLSLIYTRTFLDDASEILSSYSREFRDTDVATISDRAQRLCTEIFTELYTFPRVGVLGRERQLLSLRIGLMCILLGSGQLTPLDPQDDSGSHVDRYIAYWLERMHPVLPPPKDLVIGDISAKDWEIRQGVDESGIFVEAKARSRLPSNHWRLDWMTELLALKLGQLKESRAD